MFMFEHIEELTVLRNNFKLKGNLRVEPNPFYDNLTKLPVVLYNNDETICVEVGAVVSGRVAVFTDFASKASELITLSEKIISLDPAKKPKKVAIYSGCKPNTAMHSRCIDIVNERGSATCYVVTMAEVKQCLNEELLWH